MLYNYIFTFCTRWWCPVWMTSSRPSTDWSTWCWRWAGEWPVGDRSTTMKTSASLAVRFSHHLILPLNTDCTYLHLGKFTVRIRNHTTSQDIEYCILQSSLNCVDIDYTMSIDDMNEYLTWVVFSAGKLKNFYQSVAEHKDICKLVVLLTSAVNSLRKPASDVLKQFHPFKVVWAEDRQIKVKVCQCKSQTFFSSYYLLVYY